MDWSNAPLEGELTAQRRALRTEHLAVVRDFAEGFVELSGWLVAETRAYACFYKDLGNPALYPEGELLVHAQRVRASCERLGWPGHPVLRFARESFEALWSRFALTLWEHAEEGVRQQEALVAQAQEWAEGDEQWSAGGFDPEWPAGRKVPLIPFMSRFATAEDPLVSFGLEDQFAAWGVFELVMSPARAYGRRWSVYTTDFGKRVLKVLELSKPLLVEHMGEPVGDLYRVQFTWYRHVVELMEEFDRLMRKIGEHLTADVGAYFRTGIWRYPEA